MDDRSRTKRIGWALAALALCGLPAGSSEVPDRSALIALASGTLDVRQLQAPDDKLAVGAAEAGAESYLLVKFPGPVTAAQAEVLEELAERVVTYLPHDAFLVQVPAARRHLLTADAVGAVWTGLYHPAYKISPAVARLDAAAAKGDRRQVLVHVFPGADLAEVEKRIALLGRGEVVGRGAGEPLGRIRLLMSSADVADVRDDLARLADVFWIDLESRRVLLNDTTAWVAQSGTDGGQRTPVHDRGIRGQGQIIAVLDTGLDVDMCYFADPQRGLPPQNLCNGGTAVDNAQRKVIAVDFLWSEECEGGIDSSEWDTHSHGTHVAGIAAGDDFANPGGNSGDGIAPAAKLVIQDGGVETDDCADLPALGCPVIDLNPIFRQAVLQGARIHTNSWGDQENNPDRARYTAGSQDADQFMWSNKDIVLVFAAGNDGREGVMTIGSPATGKNVVAVGATERGGAAENVAVFSSCGRTDDGRVKPDVTLPGANIMSARADGELGTANCETRAFSGTSMAAPAAAGSLALIRQYFTAGWYPSGTRRAGDALTPSAALLKAMLINSGHDMTGLPPIPADCQGWGRVLLDDVLFFQGDRRRLRVVDDRDGFASGSSEPFEVTLTWTDFPSTPAAAVHLVNDLDLIVTGPGGTYRGNVFSGGASTAGGQADRRDTVEQVLLKNPPPGLYTVTVRAFNVPRGPRQPYAVVVTGDLPPCGNDADCDDGVFCNGAETCDGSSCQPGADPCPGQVCDEAAELCLDCLTDADCDDGVGCTLDTCDEDTTTCVHTASDALCDDGFLCNGDETCDAVLDCRPGTPVACDGSQPADAACLSGDRFCVEARWTDFAGDSGRAQAVELTDESGYFWFFDDANVELLVKVLRACFAPFDHYWAFSTGLTNVGVELAVTDLSAGETKIYSNPVGSAFPAILDTSAFATCDVGGGGPAPAQTAPRVEPAPAKGTCAAGPTSLCLGGRFRVEAGWATPDGASGAGNAVELTDDTGYFWFFNQDNVEVLVKVLDACGDPAFHRYWVFAAGLTDVEVDLTVTDTATGAVRPYHNPQRTPFVPVLDIQAFDTCP
jgi:subtilisin family serine protease